MNLLKPIITVISLMLITFASYSQKKKSLFGPDENVVWTGIDFSLCKFVGTDGFRKPEAIKGRFFNAWNELILVEREKFDVWGALRLDTENYNLNNVTSNNDEIDMNERVITHSNHSISLDEIQKELDSYKNETNQAGVGVVFFVEQLNKLNGFCSVFLTFYDLQSKKILLSKKVNGVPTGFGLRNYWGGGFYHIIKDIRKNYNRYWVKNYAPLRKN